MALRFQKKDEVDRAAKEARQTGVMVFLLVFLAVITGAGAWLSGESLASYERELGFYICCAFVTWLALPIYHEFRIRTKEIDGKASAVEDAVNASKEAHAELLERLIAIERKLDAMRSELDSRIESTITLDESTLTLRRVSDGLDS